MSGPVTVTAVPAYIDSPAVKASPILTLLVVVKTCVTGASVIASPTVIESPIPIPVIEFNVNSVVPIHAVDPAEIAVFKVNVLSIVVGALISTTTFSLSIINIG